MEECAPVAKLVKAIPLHGFHRGFESRPGLMVENAVHVYNNYPLRSLRSNSSRYSEICMSLSIAFFLAFFQISASIEILVFFFITFSVLVYWFISFYRNNYIVLVSTNKPRKYGA